MLLSGEVVVRVQWEAGTATSSEPKTIEMFLGASGAGVGVDVGVGVDPSDLRTRYVVTPAAIMIKTIIGIISLFILRVLLLKRPTLWQFSP